jgi:hypothetical protein
MAAIPTSNKPTDNDNPQKPLLDDEEFNKKLNEAIRVTKDEVDKARTQVKEAEKLKISTVWSVGERMNEFCKVLPDSQKGEIIKRFNEGAGWELSMYYLALQVVNTFTKEDYDKMAAAGLSVRLVKALVTIKDAPTRKKLMTQACEGKLKEDDIRTITGAKGKRKAAVSTKTRDKSKNMSPFRVFVKAVDRSATFSESMGCASDAVNRLSECKDEEERQDAIVQLQKFREQCAAIGEELKAFLTFTKTFEKIKIAKK